MLVALALATVALRFRARPGQGASRATSAPRLEVAYAIALAVVAGLLLWRSFDVMSQTSNPKAVRAAAPAGGAQLTIAVVASQWNWRLRYPGGVVQTGDGDGRVATLVVPAGRTVRFRLTSRDVVHALWIPALRVKYDAMPGYDNVFALRFERGRDYATTRCAEFCGAYHDRMRLRVEVRSPRAFDAWLRARREHEGA